MAVGAESVSVRHLWCCVTLFNGRFILFIRLRVAVSHGSTFELSTTFGEPRGAKAAAEAGSRVIGMAEGFLELEENRITRKKYI